LEDITAIDPYSSFMEYTDATGASEHRLKDNEVLIVNYIKKNDVWIVDKMDFISDDPSGFTKTLIPEDLMGIS